MMTSFTPVSLSGDNLGQRHRHLNSLVRDAAESGAAFHDVEALPEHSPLDRLFKIDFAVKLQHVDYIIRNLKHDDMLFVSRALKSTWLLDHHEIINPIYLENVLFPEMVTPAVSKIKHWLYINLREPTMCQEFYQHYKENTFGFAIKFLTHCSQQFILEEVPNILNKLTPHYLKLLCEKCPRVAKIYFDSLATDEDLKTRYLEQDQSYYDSIKCVLKSDVDVFLDITEKFFHVNEMDYCLLRSFRRLSPTATDYILRHHKTRFTSKLELYVAYFLHIPSVAARLSVEECQDVVIRLARAKYLQHWFEYKVVEPLIKRLSPDKRAAFKTRVFVDKDVGELVFEWPYEIPTPPKPVETTASLFDDQEFPSVCWENSHDDFIFRKKRRTRGLINRSHGKTELDRLYDEFRFIGFHRALHDLTQRLKVAGSADKRRDMFLVLVSKTGGRNDAVSALLHLAARHGNEPAHMRAAVLRSLVKRANVWRLPADAWQHYLDFGHGLGLDGTSSEAACREGLHAVVIRQLLAGECEQAVRVAFLSEFSTLAEYALMADERVRVATGLQNMLTAAATNVEPAEAAKRLQQLLDVVKTYRVRVEADSPAVKAVIALALRDADLGRPILEQLYNARIARRELLRINLQFRYDEAALLNALRHDPSALDIKRVVDMLAARETHFDRFTSKLGVYFNQESDLTPHLRTALIEKITKEQKVKCARPLACFLGNEFEKKLSELDAEGKDLIKCAAALRACAHRARPVLNLVEWTWRRAGVKAVATRAMRCREIEKLELIRALMTDRRTVRVALALSIHRGTISQGDCYENMNNKKRKVMDSASELLIDTFSSAAQLRPAVALRVALLYFRRYGASADIRVWDIVKPLFSRVDLHYRDRLRQLVGNIDWIPSSIKPSYCIALFLALNKFSIESADEVLSHLCKLLPKCDESVDDVLLQLLENKIETIPYSCWGRRKNTIFSESNDTETSKSVISRPAIFIRYLMLSRTDEDLERRFMKIGNRFLEVLDTMRYDNNTKLFEKTLNQMFMSLKYNASFFDNKYPSCLSVMERILTWMQKFMPKEEYFDKYVHIHLTMLYYKAVRQSMKQIPEVFGDPKRKDSEGVDIVGFVFGRYIAKEVAELVSEYFDSIVELYSQPLIEFLMKYFVFGQSGSNFTDSVVKGILTDGVGIQRRLAVYVRQGRTYSYVGQVATIKQIDELMGQEKDLQFFIHA